MCLVIQKSTAEQVVKSIFQLFNRIMEAKLWNRNFVLSCIGNFLMFFSFYLLVPILPIYLDEVFSASKSAIGAILSLYALTALIIRPFSGYIVDNFPRKKVLLVCYFGFFILFAGYILAGTLLLFTIVRSLHGFTFGAVSVSNNTMAIDVMPSAKRGSGIAYYGVANNLAMCIGPMSTMYMHQYHIEYDYIFLLATVACGLGFMAVSLIKAPVKQIERKNSALSLDRFWLKSAWRESLNLVFVSFAYGLMTTFLAIYGKEELGIESGSGTFFLLFAIGIIVSRLVASHWINRGYVTINVTVGTSILLAGYLLFTFYTAPVGYYSSAVVIGLGQGLFLPAYQTMFINLAPNSSRGTANSTYLTSWDIGAGIGITAGGAIVDHMGYTVAFASTALSVGIALLLFQLITARHFNRCKLRG